VVKQKKIKEKELKQKKTKIQMNDDCKGTYNDIKKGNEGNKAYNTPALNSTK